jgi:hypothetical protein
MSEETNNESTQAPSDLQERVNRAYIAKGYTLLNGGTDNIIMIQGEKNNNLVDTMLTYDGISEVLESLKPDIEKKIITE